MRRREFAPRAGVWWLLAAGALLAWGCADAPPAPPEPTTETTSPTLTATTSAPASAEAASADPAPTPSPAAAVTTTAPASSTTAPATTTAAADAAPIQAPAAVKPADPPNGDDTPRHFHEYGGEDHHHHAHMHATSGIQPRDGHHHANSGVSVHGDIHTHPHLDPHAGPHHEHPHTHMSPLELGLVFLGQMGFPENPAVPPAPRPSPHPPRHRRRWDTGLPVRAARWRGSGPGKAPGPPGLRSGPDLMRRRVGTS